MNTIEIFSDGSHFKHGDGYLGIGVFCSYMGKEYKLSGSCDAELLKQYGITETNLSNPSAEFISFAETLKLLRTVKNEYIFVFKIDYEGVRKWMSGEWKCKQPYIKKIKEKCDEYLKEIKGKIQFEDVKGHSKIYGNEQADKLAKNREKIDTLTDFFKTL